MSAQYVTGDDSDLEVAELGERAAYWLAFDELSAAFSAALGCYAKCTESLRGIAPVPPEWKPSTDEHGMWHMPGDDVR